MENNNIITIQTTVHKPITDVWRLWTEPQHILEWNNASEDWHTPKAENDLRAGGRFSSRMEAKDGSMGFDFGGVYDKIITHERISYTIDDGRKVDIVFTEEGGENTKILETFEPENQNSAELQRQGWQSILNNFKRYAEKQ